MPGGWGLGQGTPTEDVATGTGEMPSTDVHLPAVGGMGAFGSQPDVFASRAADADTGEVELEETDVVVTVPILTWPGGRGVT